MILFWSCLELGKDFLERTAAFKGGSGGFACLDLKEAATLAGACSISFSAASIGVMEPLATSSRNFSAAPSMLFFVLWRNSLARSGKAAWNSW